jgi:general secretion pathway protein B
MSYILEAIKKLEQKRQQEGLPGVLTLQSGITYAPRKRVIWPYVVAGIILLNGVTALSLMWVIPSRHAEPPVKALPASVPAESKGLEQIAGQSQVSASPEKVVKAETNAIAGQNQAPPSPEKAVKAEMNAAVPNPNTKAAEPPPVQTVRAVAPKPDKAVPQSPARPAKQAKPVPPASKAAAIQHLPENLKASLPDLKMTVHSWDEQSRSRFAIINNKNLKEGDYIIPELKVEHITQNGAILNYQGHTFLLGIN